MALQQYRGATCEEEILWYEGPLLTAVSDLRSVRAQRGVLGLKLEADITGLESKH
jgi:hypothetical protein